MSESLVFESARAQLKLLTNATITSADLRSAYTERISQVDGALKSVLAQVDSTPAPTTGPLSGLCALIKDNIEAVGLPATAGSLALTDRAVTQDSPLVQRLRIAGVDLIGSTNLSEWANIRSSQSTSGWSAVGGLTANPWALDRSAGGSSSGSGAAVAAGLASFAIGTETDGSIICPAALTGCVGIKPTVGSVPTQGIVPISKSQDSPGPLTRSVDDAALVLSVLMNRPELARLQSAEKLKIGVVDAWRTGHEATDELFDQVIEMLSGAGLELGTAKVTPRDEQSGEDEGTVLFHELVEDLDEYLISRPGDGVRSLAEVIEFNLANAETELAYFGQEFFELALRSGGRNQKYRTARVRNLDWAINRTLAPALSNFDVLIAPAYGPAWLATPGHGDVYVGGDATGASAVAGWPIGTLPMGFVEGLPIGLAVVARENDEAGLIRAMLRIEDILGLGILRPTFANTVGQTQVGSVGHPWSH
jgi:amidase